MDSAKKILPFANGLALVLTIMVNYLSNAGLLNGNSMKTDLTGISIILRRPVMPSLYGALFI